MDLPRMFLSIQGKHSVVFVSIFCMEFKFSIYKILYFFYIDVGGNGFVVTRVVSEKDKQRFSHISLSFSCIPFACLSPLLGLPVVVWLSLRLLFSFSPCIQQISHSKSYGPRTVQSAIGTPLVRFTIPGV